MLSHKSCFNRLVVLSFFYHILEQKTPWPPGDLSCQGALLPVKALHSNRFVSPFIPPKVSGTQKLVKRSSQLQYDFDYMQCTRETSRVRTCAGFRPTD